MKSVRFFLTLPIIYVFFAGQAFAQDEDEEASTSGKKIIYKAKTEIDFEAVEVAGELVKPQGVLLLDRKKASFNPLINLRQDFNPEMEASIDEIR